MGCTSKGQTVDDENNDIRNYDERDNFYTFHQKNKNKNKDSSQSNHKNKKKYNNNETSSDEDNNSQNIKKGDLNRDNSSNKNNNNNNNSSNQDSSSPNKNKNNKKNNLNEEGEEINESNLFKENSGGEIEYYKKKLAQKKAGINDNNNYDSNYSKVMYDYKNIFDDNGGKIPEYKIYAKNYKNKEKNKFIKKSKLNGIIIVEDLKDYFPKDISRDEIQELIFEAFGDNIVEDDDLIIPGQTASYDQVLQLCDYVFNYIKGNERKMKENNALKNLNIKIDLVSLDKKLIKDKVYKGKDINERQVNDAMDSYNKNKKDVKVLTIEFL